MSSRYPFIQVPGVIPGADALVLDPEKVGSIFNSTPVSPSAPGKVTGLEASQDGASVDLEWSIPTGVIAGYIVEMKASSASTWLSYDHESTTPAYSFDGLTPGLPYDFRVRAYGPYGSGLPSDVESFAMTVPPETGAVAHWMFGTDNPTRADLVSGRIIRRTLWAQVSAGGSGYTTAPAVTATDDSTWIATVSGGVVNSVRCTNPGTGSGVPTLSFGGPGSGAAATAVRGDNPTESDAYVTTTGGSSPKADGLLTDIAHATNQTLWAVVKYKTSSHLIMGNLTDNGYALGQSFYRDGASNYMNQRPGSGTVAVTMPSLAVGDWYFVTYSMAIGGTRRVFVGGNADSVTDTPNVGLSALPIGLGNATYPATTLSANGVDVAEFGIFNAVKSDAEMKDLYTRSKARMAARGISVL